ncbi:hypothetical protein PVAG01_09478 [Phlyctema vagabunda]|uniref:Rhodopsin domain-containing protein n=1 Tax=Phlyctema vagabunda TaxID=108571 RepID=A0ABR4P850_9HELO
MMVSQDISHKTNLEVLVACLCVAAVFVSLRVTARWFKVHHAPLEAEDLCIYLSLASFAVMCALYITSMPTLYNAAAVMSGKMAPYDNFKQDVSRMLKKFFAVQIFFWLTLWAVKASLMFMIRKLTLGLPVYTRLWSGLMVFIVLAFVGCVVSQFTSCSSMHAWFTAGLCATERDATAQAASLWYALAVDLLTDLMIMAIPIRLLWNLRISTIEKVSLCIVFTVGIITMVFAIVRVVSLDSSVSGGQVSTTWLIFWAAIEGAVAIIVGCLPAFAIFLRGRLEAHRSKYANYTDNSTGSNPVSNSFSVTNKSRLRTDNVALDVLEPARLPSGDGESRRNLVWGGDHMSMR